MRSAGASSRSWRRPRPSKTAYMYAPAGFVSASTTAKYTRMCATPMAVIDSRSEPLWPDQREDQVQHHDHGADREHEVLHDHTQSRSQIDANSSAKIRAATSTNATSIMIRTPRSRASPPLPAERADE